MAETSPQSSIVLLPGLGADQAMYAPQRAALGDRVVTPSWIDPLAVDESLESYARRMAEQIHAMPNLRKPYFIGGLSFGGMLAGEICELPSEDVAGLLLIGSCTHRSQIRYRFRAGEMLIRVTPPGLIKGWLNKVVPSVFAWQEHADAREAELLGEIAFRTDPRLLKWGARAIRNWRSQAASRVPIYRAHGKLDDVIPIREQDYRDGIDLIVEDGRHLINLTHAEQVNAWLAKTCG